MAVPPLEPHEIEIALCVLCDVIKRLERAIMEDAPEDRAYYVQEAYSRRKGVEKKLLRGIIDEQTPSD